MKLRKEVEKRRPISSNTEHVKTPKVKCVSSGAAPFVPIANKTGANSGTKFTPIDPEKNQYSFLFSGSSKGITSGDSVEYTIDNIALEPGVYDAQMTFEYGTQKKIINCYFGISTNP